MQPAPSVTYPLGPSWVYRAVSLLLTALVAVSFLQLLRARLLLHTGFGVPFVLDTGLVVLAVVSLCAALALVFDAFKLYQGDLRYSAGSWTLANQHAETTGTLHVHIDLQIYILLSFTAHGLNKKTWLHIERRFQGNASRQNLGRANAGRWLWAHHWMDMRRAFFAPDAAQASERASSRSADKRLV